jgi:hypothetical protein
MGLRGRWKLKRFLTRRRESVFLACMPKSGSTFLKRALLEVTGFSPAYLSYAFERNEQDLYFPALVDHWNIATVTQQHVRATGPNLKLMHWFGIRPVILVRNLFDTVVSIRDYLFAETVVSIRDYLFAEGFQKFPSLYVTERMADLSPERQLDLLITHALPWYFNFYVSWFDSCRTGSIDAMWLSYDDLIQDWPAGIRTVLEFYGIPASEEHIRTALEHLRSGDPSDIRLNVGMTGRGAGLSEAQRDRIREQAAFYPWVDFTRIGIT